MIEVAILKWSLLNTKQKWINSDIQKNEKINADKKSDGRNHVINAHTSYCVYFRKIKKEI